jgi:hypothetical protein
MGGGRSEGNQNQVRILCRSVRRDLTELYVVGPRGSEGHSSHLDDQPAAPNKRRDFDDGANALRSLRGKEAQAHDKFQKPVGGYGWSSYIRAYINPLSK